MTREQSSFTAAHPGLRRFKLVIPRFDLVFFLSPRRIAIHGFKDGKGSIV